MGRAMLNEEAQRLPFTEDAIIVESSRANSLRPVAVTVEEYFA